KGMTVSTVIAGLLPIMWSNRVGAEVMKPLATPVLGGMLSSLVHVLIVTPVIFFWLRERQLGLQREVLPDVSDRVAPRRVLVVGRVGLLAVSRSYAAWAISGRRTGRPAASVADSGIVQTVRSGNVEIV